jgi:hypothetical protein
MEMKRRGETREQDMKIKKRPPKRGDPRYSSSAICDVKGSKD